MIAKMQKIRVIGMKTKRKAIMELLQKSGAVELIQQEIEATEAVDVSGRLVQFERYLTATKQALDILDQYEPPKTALFASRKAAPMADFSMYPNEAKQMGDLVFGIASAQKKMREFEIEIGRLRSRIAALVPWTDLDVPLNYGGTAKTRSAIAMLPFAADYNKIGALLGAEDSILYYEIVKAEKDCTRVFFMYAVADAARAESAMRTAGFIPPSFELSHRTAKDKIRQLQDKINEMQAESEAQKQWICTAAAKRPSMQLFYDHITMRRDKYLALEKLRQTAATFVLEGYVPQKKANKIQTALEQQTDAYVEITEIPKDEEAPVLLENNVFARPVEGITKTYSMPGKQDIDPNGIMAVFYYVFFGMMFSDAGYGLLQVLVTGYLGFFAKVEEQTKQNMRMFFYCGISTTFWGIMYGSFFGNALTVILQTFFGIEFALTPLWLDPVREPLSLLIFSVGIGLLQILVGLALKFYGIWRQGDKLAACFDVGFWIIILLGVCVLAGGMMGNVPVLTDAGLCMMLFGAIGLVLTQGRHKKNIFGKLVGGLLSLYDITSYVSDALSYSRLMALGLATGVIAQVVNTMGALGGKSVIGTVAFILIFIVGHLINFSLNCLGAYVHTNRLQYVEFFSKFYEGGGRAFEPLKMNTKYYEFMED